MNETPPLVYSAVKSSVKYRLARLQKALNANRQKDKYVGKRCRRDMRCKLTFKVWGYVRSEVNFRPGIIASGRLIENREWTLIETRTRQDRGAKFAFDKIDFFVTIKRKPTFIIINVILPIIFMAITNMLVFLLPVESGERISYSVTVLLAIAVFMTLVGENLPKTSETMPILSYYLIILLILSTLVTVTTILNLKMFFKKGKVPACLRFLFRILFCFPCRFRKKKIDRVNKVDVVSTITADNLGKEEPEITWQDISVAVDRIALVVFLLGTIAVNAVFLVILAKNKNVAFNEI
ncbi:5-hydroxytryptamine receptor 3A-like [Mercenaria mercenaria]|uniref:5-hydroxytryptamine receptor 3A-like n=1 Tax=Mercenaria mercenaria TaxID=6596 RepID=UPI00234E9807|nr:5-hydroxytryptamine receptor 3A-like [Mercenaria mercenaria]